MIEIKIGNWVFFFSFLSDGVKSQYNVFFSCVYSSDYLDNELTLSVLFLCALCSPEVCQH